MNQSQGNLFHLKLVCGENFADLIYDSYAETTR